MTSPVHYRGDFKQTFRDSTGEFVTICRGNASLTFEDMELEAHEIEIHQSNFMLYAKAKIDTLEDGTTKIIGLPKFSEKGTEPMYAMKMEYNFNTRKGHIYDGKTTVEKSQYLGEEIKKIGARTFFIKDGKFTTCDADTPSYWFHSKKIRMVQNDMLYSGPVWMHLHEIPFPLPLPFGMFSMKKGKRSGIELPSYEGSDYRGRGLKDFGFYYAANEYWQSTLLGSYYEKTGFDFSLNTEFKKRYKYNGKIYLSWKNQPLDNPAKYNEKTQTFQSKFNFHQKVDPSFTIDLNGEYKSSNTNAKLYRKIEDQLNQEIRSTLKINKRWGTGNAFASDLQFVENLISKTQDISFSASNQWSESRNSLRFSSSLHKKNETGNKNYILQNTSFSHQQRELISSENVAKKKWYHGLRYSYTFDTKTTGKQETYKDEFDNFIEMPKEEITGAIHKPRLSFTGLKLFKYFNLTPSINYTEIWIDKIAKLRGGATDKYGNDSLVVDKIENFGALRTFDVSAQINTNIYGVSEPKIFGLEMLRHKLSPSVSFSYRPNFREEKYGNGEIFTDSLGKETFIDKFKFSPFGQTPSGESFSANISVNNLFSAKYLSDEKEKKIDFFKVGMRTNINFLADSTNRISDLAMTYSLPTPIPMLSINANSLHSWYELTETGQKMNKILFPLLKRAQITSSINLSKSTLTQLFSKKDEKKDIDYLKNFKYDWKFAFNFSYGYNPYQQIKINKRMTGTFSANMNLTKQWKINYRADYDAEDFQLTYQSIDINRDMGCWTFKFNYVPTSYNRHFLLTISIKDDMLKDLEYKRRSRYQPGYE
jgi:hypothetical protein